MCYACDNVPHMTMIQIRNVPEDIHRKLKVRAATQGLSLSEYLLREIAKVAARPTLEDVISEIQKAGSVTPAEDAATAVRAERDAR